MARVNRQGLDGKLKAVARATVKAQRKAKRDAAKQTKTAISKGTGKVLNLPAKRIKNKVRIKRLRQGDEQQVRTSYQAVPAHHFIGWTYVRGTRTGLVRETAKVARFAKSGSKGLHVRFRRGKEKLDFGRAFRQDKVGQGQVFIQRKGRARYPLAAITGPSPHGHVDKNSQAYSDIGAGAYRRRLKYWRDTEIRRVGRR